MSNLLYALITFTSKRHSCMKRILFVFLFFILQNFQNLNAQWVITHGPNGGYINSVEVFGNKIIVSNDNGINTSSDEGNTWSNSGLIPRPYYFASIDSVLYCAENFVVYKSIDSGKSWNSIFQIYPDNNNYYSITDLFAKDSFLFVSVNDSGIFRSKDGGASWVPLNLGIIDSTFLQMASIGNFIFLNSGHRIYRSSNNGDSWDTLVVSTTPGDYFYTLKAFDSLVFVSAYGRVYYSKDFGQTWDISPGNFPGGTFAWDIAQVGSKIYLTTENKIFSTDESNIFWTEVPNSLSPEVAITKLYANGNYLLGTSIGDVGGILLSVNNAASWKQIGLPIPASQVLSGNNTLFATTASEVYMSKDKGNNWMALPNTYSVPGPSTITLQGNYLFGNFDYGGGVYRLYYPGVTYSQCNWIDVNGTMPGYGTLTIYSDGNNLYEGGVYNDAYRSVNNGGSWEVIDNGLPSPALVGAFASNSQYLFAGTIDSGLYRSTDHGNSWTHVGSGLPEIPIITSIITNNNFLLVGTGYGVYASSDNGGNFLEADSGLPLFCEASLGIKNNDLFACTCKGIYWSHNNGATWMPINDGLVDPVYASSIAFDISFMYIGNHGVWKRNLQDTNLSVNTIDHASQLKIFPNPCSDEFYISSSDKTETLYVTVINELGQDLTELTLFHGTTQKVDMRAYPPGIYFIKLFSATMGVTTRLVIKH